MRLLRPQVSGQAHRDLRDFKTHSLSCLKCHLTYCACRQAGNVGSVLAGQKEGQGPALLLLKPEQCFLHCNFPKGTLALPDAERLLLNHDAGILGPWRRRIQSGAREEA